MGVTGWVPHTIRVRHQGPPNTALRYGFEELRHYFDPAPMPVGGWPLVEPGWSRRKRERYHAKELAKRQARMELMQRKMAMCRK